MVSGWDCELAEAGLAATRRTSRYMYYTTRLFLGRQAGVVLCMAYSYFRWFDDSIDREDVSQKDAQALAARQRALLMTGYEGSDPPRASCVPEQQIAEVIRWDRAYGCRLRGMITMFCDALSWDADRRHSMVGQQALDEYSRLLGCAYSHGLLFGLGLNPQDRRYERLSYLGGVASHLAHIVRDLELDLELGYVNISSDDQRRFDIDLSRRDAGSLLRWRRHVAEKAHSLFCEARSHRNALPSLRARIVYDLVSSRYARTANHWRQAGAGTD